MRTREDFSSEVLSMIFANMPAISKWRRRFLRTLFRTVFAIRGRVNFTNLARFCSLHEQTFRRQFAEGFDWLRFNKELLRLTPDFQSTLFIGAIDCTFLPKSGTETYGLDRFWSGAANRAERGLEASVMALIRTDNGEAFAAGARQTPSGLADQKEGNTSRTRVDFYVKQLTDYLARWGQMVRYVVADGYYAKTKVFDAVCGTGGHLITKLRSDANLRYFYTGLPKEGPGRPKTYDGKVDFNDLARFDHVGELADKSHLEVYTQKLNSEHFGRDFRVVVLVDTKAESYVVLAATDCDLGAMNVVRFYRLRFQIELIFRDAKQFAGLTHCQARSKEKLAFHLNMSLAAINLARLRILHSEKAISISNCVRQAYNRWLAGHLLSRLGLRSRFGLNHPQVQQVIRMGSRTI
jgi:hypothetical protein